MCMYVCKVKMWKEYLRIFAMLRLHSSLICADFWELLGLSCHGKCSRAFHSAQPLSKIGQLRCPSLARPASCCLTRFHDERHCAKPFEASCSSKKGISQQLLGNHFSLHQRHNKNVWACFGFQWLGKTLGRIASCRQTPANTQNQSKSWTTIGQCQHLSTIHNIITLNYINIHELFLQIIPPFSQQKICPVHPRHNASPWWPWRSPNHRSDPGRQPFPRLENVHLPVPDENDEIRAENWHKISYSTKK